MVIITRPDIIFYDKLDLTPFYEKKGGWDFFEENKITSYVFSTYINSVTHSVIIPENYIPGIDLLLFAHPDVINKLASWEENINSCLNLWAEYAIIKMMNKFNLKHSYITYEKDKFWTITRIWESNTIFFLLKTKYGDIFYNLVKPILLFSNKYCRHTFSNVTTYKNKDGLKEYLKRHLK